MSQCNLIVNEITTKIEKKPIKSQLKKKKFVYQKYTFV